MHLLPNSKQVRTLLPILPPSPFLLSTLPTSFPALYSHLVSWIITEYDASLSSDSDSDTSSSSPSPSSQRDFAPSLLFTTLFSFLSLTQNLPPDSTSTSYVLSGLSISRKDVASGTRTAVEARLGFVDALTRIVAREWRREEEEKAQDARTGAGEGLNEVTKSVRNLVDEPELATRVERLEAAIVEQQENEALAAEVEELKTRLDLLEESTLGRKGKRRKVVAPTTTAAVATSDAGQGDLSLVVMLLVGILAVMLWPVVKELWL